MGKQSDDGGGFRCPVYELLERLGGKGKGASEFFGHLRKAHVELLLAVRGLIDQRVEQLSKERGAGPRARRIKVVEKD